MWQWDSESGAAIGTSLGGRGGPVLGVAYSPDGTRIVSGGDDGRVRQWDSESGAAVGTPLEGHGDWVRSVAYSPDGTRIVSGGDDGRVRQWDSESGAAISTPLEGHEDWVLGVAYSPDGMRIVSGGRDGTVRQWGSGRAAAIGTPLEVRDGLVLSVAYSPDSTRIVSGGDDGRIQQWDSESGAAIGTPLEGHGDWVWSVAYSPDGTRIVSGGNDGRIQQWDSESGAAIGAPLGGHDGGVLSVAYSPDGTRIASGGDDGRVRQWDSESGAAIGTPLEGHDGGVLSVAYSPDGMRIVSGGRDGRVWQWDSESGTPAGTPVGGREGPVWSVSFIPDGMRIVSGGSGRWPRLWHIGLSTPPLLIWVLLLVVVIGLRFCVRVFLAAWRTMAAPQPNVPALVSDGPISDPMQATTAMREVVARISRFLRNPNAAAPLTVAVIGQWGSGKSSLMKLIEKDLRKDLFPCIWFNAWHHQNETHLFAALMESIRLNAAVPRSFSGIGRSFAFYVTLVRRRFKNAPISVLLFSTLVSIGVYVLFALWQQMELDSFSWDLVKLDSIDNWKDFIGDSWPLSVPLSFLFLIWKGRWNPLKAFGITPASLIRASTAWIQFPRFRDRLSFRDQFGRAFGEVCEAFGSRRLVIIIDDLDRCRPEQVVEILEAVNFLVSSGDCFVLLGIDENQVEHAVGLNYRDIAEEMGKEAEEERPEGMNNGSAGSINGGLSETDKYNARQSYARLYLKKLINLKVKVPVVDDRDLSSLRETSQS